MPVVTKTDVYAKIPTQNNDMKVVVVVEAADWVWLILFFSRTLESNEALSVIY